MQRRLLILLLGTVSLSLQAKTIELTDDLICTGQGSCIDIPRATLDNETLVVRSTLGKSIILTSKSLWNISDSGYAKIEFAGNARLVCETGSRLHGTGGVLRFVDEACLIVGKG